MEQFQLTTLKHTDLTDLEGTAVLSVLAQPKRFALLVYLTVEGSQGLVRRDQVVALFWPERDQTDARANLRRSLYFLRQSLGQDAIVTRGDEEVGVDPEVVHCDVVAALAGDASVDHGTFLKGFHFSGAPVEWEEWLRQVRERVRTSALPATGSLGFTASDARPSSTSPPGTVRAPGSLIRRWRSVALATSALAVALFAWTVARRSARPAGHATVARFPSPFLPGQEPRGPMALTPDGSALVYVRPSAAGTGQQLWIRRWENLEASPIPGTEGAQILFALSPDGRKVAFVTRNMDAAAPIMVAPLDGGAVRRLREDAYWIGGWGDDDGIYYFGLDQSGVRRIGAQGGASALISANRTGERLHVVEDVLPGARTALVEGRPKDHWGWSDHADIWALDLETGARTFLAKGHSARYAASGHLLFVRGDALMAARFDEERKELVGPAVEVQRGLFRAPYVGSAIYDVSESGMLAYMTGQPSRGTHQFVWMDRTGRMSPVDSLHFFQPGPQGSYGWRLSPHGDRIAFQATGKDMESIWTKALPDRAAQRLTVGEGREEAVAWSPDGRYIMYRSRHTGRATQLWAKKADGSEKPELLLDGLYRPRGFWAPPHGEWIVVDDSGGIGVHRSGADSVRSLVVKASLHADADPGRLVGFAAVSPDGRWLAYSLDRGGRVSVWVQPFPEAHGARREVSPEGGVAPIWAHNGRELFFVNARTRDLVALEYRTTPTFRVVARSPLFTIPEDVAFSQVGAFYDVAPDDRRFLMARFVGSVPGNTPHPVVVVQDFYDELRERLGG